MNQICQKDIEIWFRTDKKCGRTDGRTELTDDAKTISPRLRRGITNVNLLSTAFAQNHEKLAKGDTSHEHFSFFPIEYVLKHVKRPLLLINDL